MAKDRREHQVSVTLDRELRAALERAAEAEHRTVSGQIRHLVAKVYEDQSADRAA